MTLEIQVLGCERHTNVAGLKQLMASQPSPLENWISNVNIYIYTNDKITCTEFASTSVDLKTTTLRTR
jgi:hypothetical protein